MNRELGEKTNDDELRAMINEFDRDGDGESELVYNHYNYCYFFTLICCYFIFF